MNILEAKEEIKRAVRAYGAKTDAGTYRLPVQRQRPILLMGPPGIGKTAIMEQIARECGLGLVSYTMTHHTRQSAVGLPILEKKTFDGGEQTVTSYTMSEIIASVYEQREEMSAAGADGGILFLDEINCVSETLMPAMLSFLQYKSFGGHSLPEGWMIVAAGNPVKYNRYAREFDSVVMDRVRLIEVEPDIKVWKSYASEMSLHPAVMTFTETVPEYFYIEEDKGHGIVTARSWEDLSEILCIMEDEGIAVEASLFGQYIQYGPAAEEFGVYYRIYRKWSCIAPYRWPDVSDAGRMSFEERISIVWLLLHQVQSEGKTAHERREFAESLKYLSEGVSGGRGIRLSLDDRARALAVKKKYGLLKPGEEEKERRLYDAAMKCERQAAAGADAVRLLEELSDREMTGAESLYQRFERDLSGCADFIEKNFGTDEEFRVYLSGCMENEYCRRLMEKRCTRLYERACGMLDADAKEAALRRRLEER